MAVKDVTQEAVEAAIEEFCHAGLEAMLGRYGGGPSTKWHVQADDVLYDQKLVVRAAHVLQGLGELSPGGGSFDAGQARRLLKRLGYRVVPKLTQTNENLQGPSAVKPIARCLIGAALRSTTLTYGEARSRLEKECGFSKLSRASRAGWSAGTLQHAIHRHAPFAPLLNVLLVYKDTGVPGSGAREFLAARYPEERRLAKKGVDTAYPELWARYARLAAAEAYRYDGWEVLYEALFGRYAPDPFYAPRRRAGGGGGGEGPAHEALREWARKHPECIHERFRHVDAKTEVDLLSDDRVDVVYWAPREVVVIEVKSRISDFDDFQRGVYQCVKYRAVMEAQEQEESGRRVRTFLVTETALPAHLARTAKRLHVPHRQVAPVGG